MGKFKYLFPVGLLTFAVGVLVIGIWRGLLTPQAQPDTSNILTQINQTPQANIYLITDETPDDIKQRPYLTCPDNQTRFTFRGVSFNCDPRIGSKLEVTEFSKSPLLDADFKPDGVHPSYLSFKFNKEEGKQESGTTHVSEIAVYPIEEYSQMYSITDSQKSRFNESVAALKRTIFDKQAHRNDYDTSLAWMDAHYGFKSHIKYISFKNGKGVGFVTQIQTEVTIINNEELVWAFEGITNDGKYYVQATFPIRANILPAKATDGFEGYSVSDYPRLLKRNKQYLSLIKKRLDALAPNRFEPDLQNLTDIIYSLEVK